MGRLSNTQKPNICTNIAMMKKISKLSITDTAMIYDIYFPRVLVRLKTKHIQTPWITKRIVQSSKRKQKLNEIFLKHRTRETELAYKSYKNLFESLKKKAKKKYYSEKITRYKNDAKKT